MKRVLAVLILSCNLLSATQVVSKEGSVVALLNSQSVTLSKGSTLKLQEGDYLCFKEGKGSIVIDSTIVLRSVDDPCYQKPMSKNRLTQMIKSLKTQANALFSISKPKVVDGVALKTIKQKSKQKYISIDHNQSEVEIASDHYGPLPVTVVIKNKHNKNIETFINAHNAITYFKFPISRLKSGYQIEVTNGFDEIVERYIIK
ncbi:MAG: hypothetical protein U9N49_06625 [Campylobacterota bacterium]|nr:hypothetical protein [Campylobacterota bacterium]